MKCKLLITDSAKKDFDEILSYISNELNAPQAASDFLDKVMNCYENLELNPLMYEKCAYDRLSKKGYRKAIIKNYLMIYRYDESVNTVYILRFIYGRRAYINLI